MQERGRREGEAYGITFTINDVHGNEKHMREIAECARDAERNVDQSFGLLIDQTQEKFLQKQLERGNAKLNEQASFMRGAARLAKVGCFIWDEPEERPAPRLSTSSSWISKCRESMGWRPAA